MTRAMLVLIFLLACLSAPVTGQEPDHVNSQKPWKANNDQLESCNKLANLSAYSTYDTDIKKNALQTGLKYYLDMRGPSQSPQDTLTEKDRRNLSDGKIGKITRKKMVDACKVTRFQTNDEESKAMLALTDRYASLVDEYLKLKPTKKLTAELVNERLIEPVQGNVPSYYALLAVPEVAARFLAGFKPENPSGVCADIGSEIQTINEKKVLRSQIALSPAASRASNSSRTLNADILRRICESFPGVSSSKLFLKSLERIGDILMSSESIERTLATNDIIRSVVAEKATNDGIASFLGTPETVIASFLSLPSSSYRSTDSMSNNNICNFDRNYLISKNMFSKSPSYFVFASENLQNAITSPSITDDIREKLNPLSAEQTPYKTIDGLSNNIIEALEISDDRGRTTAMEIVKTWSENSALWVLDSDKINLVKWNNLVPNSSDILGAFKSKREPKKDELLKAVRQQFTDNFGQTIDIERECAIKQATSAARAAPTDKNILESVESTKSNNNILITITDEARKTIYENVKKCGMPEARYTQITDKIGSIDFGQQALIVDIEATIRRNLDEVVNNLKTEHADTVDREILSKVIVQRWFITRDLVDQLAQNPILNLQFGPRLKYILGISDDKRLSDHPLASYTTPFFSVMKNAFCAPATKPDKAMGFDSRDQLIKTIMISNQKVNGPDDEREFKSLAGDCGCSEWRKDERVVYGFYPFWLSPFKRQSETGNEAKPTDTNEMAKIDYGLMDRIAFDGLVLDKNGNVQNLERWKEVNQAFVSEARKHRVKIDLAFRFIGIKEWNTRTTSKAAKVVVEALDVHLNESILDPLFRLFGRGSRPDGITIVLDKPPRDILDDPARDNEPLIDFICSVRSRLRPDQDLNIAFPLIPGAEGNYALSHSWDRFRELFVDTPELNPCDPILRTNNNQDEESKEEKANISNYNYNNDAGDTVIQRVLIFLPRPTTNLKKYLRSAIEETFKGRDREEVLRKIVPVVPPGANKALAAKKTNGKPTDEGNFMQFEDDLIYFEDNFAGVGFWPIPIRSLEGEEAFHRMGFVDSAHFDKFSNVIYDTLEPRSSNMPFPNNWLYRSSFCQFMCPNAKIFNYLSFFAILVVTFSFIIKFFIRIFEHYYMIILLTSVSIVTLISWLLIMCILGFYTSLLSLIPLVIILLIFVTNMKDRPTP